MKAEDYISEWCDKTYGGGKELGDWETKDVMKFANDFAAISNVSFKVVSLHQKLSWITQQIDAIEDFVKVSFPDGKIDKQMGIELLRLLKEAREVELKS